MFLYGLQPVLQIAEYFQKAIQDWGLNEDFFDWNMRYLLRMLNWFLSIQDEADEGVLLTGLCRRAVLVLINPLILLSSVSLVLAKEEGPRVGTTRKDRKV